LVLTLRRVEEQIKNSILQIPIVLVIGAGRI